MNCRDVERWSTAYVNGELDDRRASALRGHLRLCDRCRALIEDESQLLAAAEDLAPVDPPSELWSSIEQRIADAEIADAERSRVWLWWAALRERALPVAVGAVAVAVVVVWLWRRPGAPAPQTATTEPTAVTPPSAPDQQPAQLSFDAARRAEAARAEERYAKALADLRQMAADERGTMSAAETAELDEQMKTLEQQVNSEHARVAASQSDGAAIEPRQLDRLHAAYRGQVALLEGAITGGVSR